MSPSVPRRLGHGLCLHREDTAPWSRRRPLDLPIQGICLAVRPGGRRIAFGLCESLDDPGALLECVALVVGRGTERYGDGPSDEAVTPRARLSCRTARRAPSIAQMSSAIRSVPWAATLGRRVSTSCPSASARRSLRHSGPNASVARAAAASVSVSLPAVVRVVVTRRVQRGCCATSAMCSYSAISWSSFYQLGLTYGKMRAEVRPPAPAARARITAASTVDAHFGSRRPSSASNLAS